MAASRKPCLCCSELKSKCFGLGNKKCEVLNVKSNLQLLFKDFRGLYFCAAYLPANNLRRISTTYLRGYWKGSENGRVDFW
jgi:hypothetical protein